MIGRFLFIALGIALPAVATGQQFLTLDCPVTRASPLFDLADFPAGAAAIRMERYRFAIPLGGGAGLATTPRASGVAAQTAESSTHFVVDFENKRVVIDRMTAEFQVSILGAQQPLGGGTCMKLEQRKF